MNDPVPISFALRSLLVTQVRYWSVSEDGEGEPLSITISQAPDTDQLIPTIQTHPPNKMARRS